MNSISLSDTLSRKTRMIADEKKQMISDNNKLEGKLKSSRQTPVLFILLAIFSFLLSASLRAEVLDRVVAVVDDEVVLLSEFNKALMDAENAGIEVTRDEVLDGLINRILLLREAKKAGRTHVFSAQTEKLDNILINEYIEKRVKAFIRIPYDEIERFYQDNSEFFHGENFFDVRDEIEAYLIEAEVNKRLIEHIRELRDKAYIRKQLRKGD